MRRKYSDIERAEVLALCDAGISQTEIEKRTGIPNATISRWTRGHVNPGPDDQRLREEKKRSLAQIFESIAYKASGIIESKLSGNTDKLKLSELNTVAGTATDKHLLLTGQPTSIVSNLTNKLQKDFPDVPPDQLAELASEWLQ